MKFTKDNIIDKSLKNFEKKHLILSKWISFKIRLKLYLLNLKNRK